MTGSQGRHWSEDEKRAVCREAVEGSDPVAQVAKRHGLKKGRLYYWLKDPRFNPGLEGATAVTPTAGFISVRVVEETEVVPVTVSTEPAPDIAGEDFHLEVPPCRRSSGFLERCN